MPVGVSGPQEKSGRIEPNAITRKNAAISQKSPFGRAVTCVPTLTVEMLEIAMVRAGVDSTRLSIRSCANVLVAAALSLIFPENTIACLIMGLCNSPSRT